MLRMKALGALGVYHPSVLCIGRLLETTHHTRSQKLSSVVQSKNRHESDGVCHLTQDSPRFPVTESGYTSQGPRYVTTKLLSSYYRPNV